MPGMQPPPVSPEAQAQMGPPGGPNFGPGIGQAQQQMDKSPEEVAVGTVEKILMGLQSEKMRPYVMKALATLKVGLGQVQQGQPQSPGMGTPPPPGGPPGGVPGPPTPPQMAG